MSTGRVWTGGDQPAREGGERRGLARLGPRALGHGEPTDRVRDVTLGEDACRMRSGHAPHVFAAVRNAALNLLRGAGHDRIAAATRSFAAKASEALALLGL